MSVDKSENTIDVFLKTLSVQAQELDSRKSDLHRRMADIELWTSFLFGKTSHMIEYERMYLSLQREFIALASVGLTRPAFYALRSYFEVSLAWIYYHEHPREWQSCLVNGSFFLTPGNVREVVAKYFPHLKANMVILFGTPYEKIKSPYGDLSKLAHSSDPALIPYVSDLADLVGGANEFRRVQDMTTRVTDYVFNWYSACLTPEYWARMPSGLKDRIVSKVPKERFAKFRDG